MEEEENVFLHGLEQGVRQIRFPGITAGIPEAVEGVSVSLTPDKCLIDPS